MQYYSSDFNILIIFVFTVHCSYSFTFIVLKIMRVFFSARKKQLINLHNNDIRVHVWNVGIYLLHACGNLSITPQLKAF